VVTFSCYVVLCCAVGEQHSPAAMQVTCNHCCMILSCQGDQGVEALDLAAVCCLADINNFGPHPHNDLYISNKGMVVVTRGVFQ
jgi:hypothetical protein